jgi:alginate O-acetyltransferase complex protein AlgI
LAVFLARYQIYCDFSGYTDIALGSAQILGFKLTENFNRPFFSRSITEYWQRWHMSLAQWIRRYIFYPLVSTPVARFGVHGLVLITFLVLGLWHGGTVNFLIYGLWQGLFVILDSSTKTLRHQFYSWTGFSRYPKSLNAVAILGTFFLIVVPPTLFFRATDFSTAHILFKNVFLGWSMSDLSNLFQSEFVVYSLKIGIGCIVLLELMSWLSYKYELQEKFMKKSEWPVVFFWFCLVLLIFIFGYFETNSKFIYMRF